MHDRDLLPADVSLAGSASTVVSHKPGVRATVICHLDYAGADLERTSAPTAVVVKVHHDDQGRHAFGAMEALSASPLGSSRSVHLASPIAYLADLRMSVQDYVAHRCSLKDLFHRAFESGDAGCWQELLDATRATAFGLAELHQCGCTYGEQVTWDHELETLRAKHDKLAAAVPSLRDHTGPALERIQAAAARAPADPFVPTHHSFRPAQVLLRDDGVSFIDFDKFCLAEAGSDIAVVTTKLLYMGANEVGAPVGGRAADRDVRLAELRTAFLHEYGRHAVYPSTGLRSGKRSSCSPSS